MSTAPPPLSIAPDGMPAAAGIAAAGVAAAVAPGGPTVRCDNCGAPVNARYCGACGQRLEPPAHSLWQFLQVAAEDLTHADSRLWRTLAALLFKPGYLTAQFLAGRRASYLPPVRLYLVLSVVFFIWISASQSKLQVVQLDARQAAGSAALAPRAGERHSTPFSPALPGESAQQRAERLCQDMVYQGPWQQRLAPLISRACRQNVQDSGRSLREAFLHNLPRAMFVFLPLLAGAMMLMYWRPRHYYVEHVLLFVHNHAFGFVLLLLASALSALLPPLAPWVLFALWLYIPWYLYRSLRVVYGQGRWLTISKLLLLSFFYLLSGALMIGLTAAYSFITV
jgi:hypothetical protein